MKISAIVTAYERIEQTLATLRIVQSCTPPPDEILVHVDANRRDCERAIREEFPWVRVLRSDEQVGPGGGRNKLIDAAQFELVASFDDDSYPIDSDYFARAAKLFEQFPDVAVLCAALYHAGEAIGLDERSAQWTADFSGGACIYRRQAFLNAGGYVPLPVAYGMEEVDLAIRVHSRGGRILTTRWLRVFHNTNLERHADPRVTAGSIANLALLTYLRYPVSLWVVGIGQCANRLIWLLRHGRRRGILKGVIMIPAHLRANHRYRLPVSKGAMRSYLALRRAPIPERL
ncbi:MAG TPA: glycosyltransferase [Pyrinomonadaceae bacterium]|nr:glycosyltransferase [Pyrinomonadaceae bacterium]